MGVTQTRWFLAGLIAVCVILLNVLPGEPRSIGISAQWINGQYHFAGGTEPAFLCFAIVMVGIYILALYTDFADVGQPILGVFRRFVAFWIDLLVAMLAIAPVLGVVPTLLEWRRTGQFQWTFERTVVARGDSLQIWLLLPLTFGALVSYFALPLLRGRPTPGTCIMGYRVVADDGTTLNNKLAALRTLLGFVAACSAYLAPFVARDKKRGKFWLDKVFATHAVSLKD